MHAEWHAPACRRAACCDAQHHGRDRLPAHVAVSGCVQHEAAALRRQHARGPHAARGRGGRLHMHSSHQCNVLCGGRHEGPRQSAWAGSHPQSRVSCCTTRSSASHRADRCSVTPARPAAWVPTVHAAGGRSVRRRRRRGTAAAQLSGRQVRRNERRGARGVDRDRRAAQRQCKCQSAWGNRRRIGSGMVWPRRAASCRRNVTVARGRDPDKRGAYEVGAALEGDGSCPAAASAAVPTSSSRRCCGSMSKASVPEIPNAPAVVGTGCDSSCWSGSTPRG
eukprot:363687-Chlamydomonas_euryale.AAC.5